ncbi:MAG: tRNA dihydrouridine(20/20a) synthase DusA [Spirochaetes bacterium]|jgi:tRNA-dihydrouridine synthase A|nr:tRNA dihydrouridine(20/20a) synthase DusA [Spirochaetota bacterium]
MRHPVSIAPMMDWTDRHYRYFMRRITRRVLLYTEMITTGAIRFGDRDHLLGFHPDEHPLSLQIGGDDPAACAESVRAAEAYGYNEYDLNVGCPSDRVQNGAFGACLMADPDRVARVVEAMKSATGKPVTVKHRIGIDGRESYDDLADFVSRVSATNADRFIVHARVAILAGLSPKENRNVPPLRYEDVYRLKEDFPTLSIEINGHIDSLEAIRKHLEQLDGAMIGRAAYDNPYFLATADRDLYGSTAPVPSRREIAEAMIPYVEQVTAMGRSPRNVYRHMLGLFAFCPGARRYRRVLSDPRVDEADVGDTIREAISGVPAEVLDARGTDG